MVCLNCGSPLTSSGVRDMATLQRMQQVYTEIHICNAPTDVLEAVANGEDGYRETLRQWIYKQMMECGHSEQSAIMRSHLVSVKAEGMREVAIKILESVKI